jgi:4-hydroxybenzoate polyprenyltransferase
MDMALQPDSPLHQRLAGYLLERFPPVAYTLLTVLFFGSSAWVAIALGGGELRPNGWLGAVVIWLVFLHLRIFDEHKDAEVDRTAHPERLLSRGVVTLGELRVLGILAIGLEGLLSALLGTEVLIAWAVTLIFTILMALEFGVGRWLSQRLVLYAVTHNPVVALLGMLGWACTSATWSSGYLLYLGAVSLGSLAFELGRKINQPDEEIEGVDSYSSVLGRSMASWLLWATMIVATGFALKCCLTMGEVLLGAGPRIGGCIVIGGCVAGLSLSGPREKAKKVEAGATLALLTLLAGLWVAGW